MSERIGFGSLCVRAEGEDRTTPPHQLPIYATSSFRFETIDQGIDIFKGAKQGHSYSRYGNPTIDAVARKLARLEGHDLETPTDALVVSSGMSAISTLVLGLLRSGDKILTQENLYGGTAELFQKVLQPLGIEPVLTDLKDLERIEAMVKSDEQIRLIYLETPANPTLTCIDIAGIADIGRRHQRLTAADNTFCTPYLQRPLSLGLDYVIHSTTKFLNGHGNSIAGAIIGRDPEQLRARVWPAMKLAGTNGNPWDAWLLHNGLKTLALRMDRHCQNALAVARFLESHPRVRQVNYPGLPSHPDHALARSQMKDFGGMLSFELDGGLPQGIRFMNRLKLGTLAPTLGDVDTLVLHPASMSHVNIAPEVRRRNGISDGLVRISVGIEEVEDIIADLEQALVG